MRLILSGWFYFGKMWKIWKNGRFSRRLWPDWRITARAATAGSGSKGLKLLSNRILILIEYSF